MTLELGKNGIPLGAYKEEGTGSGGTVTGTAPINVDAANNITLDIDEQTLNIVDGKLHAKVSSSAPSNMVTTDTAQTISKSKNFKDGISFNGSTSSCGITGNGSYLYLNTSSGYSVIVNNILEMSSYNPIIIGNQNKLRLNHIYSNNNGQGLEISSNSLKYIKSNGTVVDLLSGATIDDTTASTTTTYSSSKINELIGSVSTLLDNINGEEV